MIIVAFSFECDQLVTDGHFQISKFEDLQKLSDNFFCDVYICMVNCEEYS